MFETFVLPVALTCIALCVCLIVACRIFDRRDRLGRAYRHVGKARRQCQYAPEMFSRAPEVHRLIRFLREQLKVPETVLGFDSQSQLSSGDLSRLVTLWAALGDDANLCYGFVDDSRRRLRSSTPGKHASIWVEFSHLGELWVYWYETDSAVVDFRRAFYKNDAATIINDVRFSEAGAYLFKSRP